MDIHPLPHPIRPDRPVLDIQETSLATAGAAVLTAVGDLDRDSAPDLATAVDRTWRTAGVTTIQVDLGRVGFVDAAGVRILLECHFGAADRGRLFTICNVRPMVRQVLDVLGLLEVLDPGHLRVDVHCQDGCAAVD